MDKNEMEAFAEKLQDVKFPVEEPKEPVLRTDDENECAKALEKTAEELEKAESDPYAWKWVIIALHNSIQALMVKRLSGTDQTGALGKKEREAAQQWLRNFLDGKTDASTFPEPYLAKFHALHKEAKKLQGFPQSEELEKDMGTLNAYRNDFIHFVPKNWGIMLRGVPTMVLGLLMIADYLIGESSSEWNWQECEELAKTSLARAKAQAQNLHQLYNPTN